MQQENTNRPKPTLTPGRRRQNIQGCELSKSRNPRLNRQPTSANPEQKPTPESSANKYKFRTNNLPLWARLFLAKKETALKSPTTRAHHAKTRPTQACHPLLERVQNFSAFAVAPDPSTFAQRRLRFDVRRPGFLLEDGAPARRSKLWPSSLTTIPAPSIFARLPSCHLPAKGFVRSSVSWSTCFLRRPPALLRKQSSTPP